MRRYKAIVSYPDMVKREGMMLQRGMNFRVKPHYSIVLMSVRKGAPYNDRWDEERGLLEYEGHDERRVSGIAPKLIDQPMSHPGGSLTENGKFYHAAKAYAAGERPAEKVQVYEKISSGIWCDRGRYDLVDAAIVSDGQRKVFKLSLIHI